MLSITTSEQDRTQPWRLDELGSAYGLRYSSEWPYGCIAATWSMGLELDFSHFALRPGRLVKIYDGVQEVWRGTLLDPNRGNPWSLNATGLASLADHYQAIDASLSPTTVPNDAVDQAILRGLPWRRDASLTAIAGANYDEPTTLATLLNDVTGAAGVRWGVFADGALVATADPTSPAYVGIATDSPGGRTVDDYVTDIYLHYLDSTTGQETVVHATASRRPFGTFERTVDVTKQGRITAINALNMANQLLALATGDLPFTGSQTLQAGALLTPGGVPVALSTVRAGRMIEMRGVAQDPAYGELNFSTVVRYVIGSCEYDQSSNTITIAPVGAKPRDLATLLARLQTAS